MTSEELRASAAASLPRDDYGRSWGMVGTSEKASRSREFVNNGELTRIPAWLHPCMAEGRFMGFLCVVSNLVDGKDVHCHRCGGTHGKERQQVTPILRAPRPRLEREHFSRFDLWNTTPVYPATGKPGPVQLANLRSCFHNCRNDSVPCGTAPSTKLSKLNSDPAIQRQ